MLFAEDAINPLLSTNTQRASATRAKRRRKKTERCATCGIGGGKGAAAPVCAPHACECQAPLLHSRLDVSSRCTALEDSRIGLRYLYRQHDWMADAVRYDALPLNMQHL